MSIEHDDEFISAAEIAKTKRAVVAGKTEGVSPKVWVPALLQMCAGIILLIFGFVVEGKTLVLSAVGTAGVGYAAFPGTVRER